jgi:HNH endonuclease
MAVRFFEDQATPSVHQNQSLSEESPSRLAARALAAMHRLCLARGAIRLQEARHFQFLHDTAAHREFGFAAFSDFVREVLQTSPRSAQRYVALHRLAVASPPIAQALREGRLSTCQALVLQPLVGLEDPEPWILRAASCSVMELQHAVTDHVDRASADYPDRANTEASSRLPLPSPPQEEPGRRITFAAPISAALAWSHGIEWARRMLGWEAPKFLCVEAILSESVSHLVGSDARVASSALNRPAGNGVGRETGLPMACLRESAISGEGSPPQTGSPPPLSCAIRESLLAGIHQAEQMLAATIGPDRPPENARDSVAWLGSLRHRERSRRLLFVRLARDLQAGNLLGALGFRNVRHLLIEEFKFSERTAARFLSEAWLFEDNAPLHQAFQDGKVGLGQAYLIDRIATRTTIQAFIARAHAVTHLHFEREVQFLEQLGEFLPSMAQQFSGPLPLPGLEEAMRERLRSLAWTDTAIDEALRGYLPWAEDAAPDEDPAWNLLVLRRLESLLEMVVLAQEGRMANGTGEGDSQEPAEFLRSSPSVLPTLAAGRRTTISFWAPQSIIDFWERSLAAVRRRSGPLPVWAAAILILDRSLQEWRKIDPSVRSASVRIQERDEWRCQAPGCSSRRRLESHHIIFRSQQGSDDPQNLVTLCHGHHRHGIHQGTLRVSGTAPSALIWRLGRSGDVWRGHKREGLMATA